MWEKYATSSCDRVRAENPPPALDEDGLFNASSATEMAGRRQCTVTVNTDLLLTVAATSSIDVVALAPARWEPLSILAACTRAHGRQAFEVDEETAKPENHKGLYEIRIARVAGADGLRPYLTRDGRYEIDDEKAKRGMPTFAFQSLIALDDRENYLVRRALRALEDVGLVQIRSRHPGGMASAEITWTDRAYLSRPTPPALDEEDDRAITNLALGGF